MRKLFSLIGILIIFLISFSGASIPKPVYSQRSQYPQCSQYPQNEIYRNIKFKVPIIMYHSVFIRNNGEYCISPSQLQKDFDYFKEKEFTPIFIKDLINFKEKGILLPKKPIIITFDDGFYDNYTRAYPIILKTKTKCVISVVGKYIDNNYKDGVLHKTYSNLTYENIREMHASGLVEFQNHSYDMHYLKGRYGMSQKKSESFEDYEKILSEDLLKNNKGLLKNTSITCTAVAFPFGKYNKNTIKIIKKLGFKASFTCNHGINEITRNSDLYLLKRYNRPSGKSSEEFFGKIFKKL